MDQITISLPIQTFSLLSDSGLLPDSGLFYTLFSAGHAAWLARHLAQKRNSCIDAAGCRRKYTLTLLAACCWPPPPTFNQGLPLHLSAGNADASATVKSRAAVKGTQTRLPALDCRRFCRQGLPAHHNLGTGQSLRRSREPTLSHLAQQKGHVSGRHPLRV